MADDSKRTQDENAPRSAAGANEAQGSSGASRSRSTPPDPIVKLQLDAATPEHPARTETAGRSLDATAADMAAAIAAEQAGQMPPPDATYVVLPDLGAPPGSAGTLKPSAIDLLADVDLNVKVELGRSRLLVEEVLRLGPGSVVELDKLAGDPVDVFVNERLVARGEVLVLNENFCVRINEIRTDFGEQVGPEE
jgi:flagellar motor switch protein FliN/FliY